MIRLPGVQFKDNEPPELRDRKLRQFAETVERLVLPRRELLPTMNNARLQGCVLQITNTAGTIQHVFRRNIFGGTIDPSNIALITSPALVLTNTPTGTDSSTAFAGGGKIGSVSPSTFILDVPVAYATENELGAAVIVESNSTTVDLSTGMHTSNLNVNGVTRNRPTMTFRNATSGATYNLTTIGLGLSIYVRFQVYLSVPP